MSVIYEPSGRAFEYSPLAVNLYTGCEHGCLYCFSPAVLRKKRSEFHSNVKPRADILKKLESDCIKLQGDPREVLLCFTCDAYSPTDNDITREALLILEKYNMKAQILTKGGLSAVRDFDILARNDWAFGTSLSWINDKLRQKWEPNAATVKGRVSAIQTAKDRGIKTWVSVEPVIDTVNALLVMGALKPFVDLWKVGKINYHKEIEDKIDWRQFLKDVKAELAGCEYYIKKDLAKYEFASAEEHYMDSDPRLDGETT